MSGLCREEKNMIQLDVVEKRISIDQLVDEKNLLSKEFSMLPIVLTTENESKYYLLSNAETINQAKENSINEVPVIEIKTDEDTLEKAKKNKDISKSFISLAIGKYSEYLESTKLKHEEIANKLSISRSEVTKLIGLSKEVDLINLMLSGEINISKAKELYFSLKEMDNERKKEELSNLIQSGVLKNLNMKDMKLLAKSIKENFENNFLALDVNNLNLIQQLMKEYPDQLTAKNILNFLNNPHEIDRKISFYSIIESLKDTSINDQKVKLKYTEKNKSIIVSLNIEMDIDTFNIYRNNLNKNNKI